MVKPSQKNIDMIKDIFEQGDVRYDNDHYATLVASFVENKGIEITKKFIKGRFNPSEEELREIRPPQQYYKFIGKKILERYFYKFICFEGSFVGFRPDIIAKHTHYNERLLVECQSCRIEKAIRYLEEDNTVLWVLSLTETALQDEPIPLYIIKRGPNWDKCIQTYENWLRHLFETIPSPLDSL